MAGPGNQSWLAGWQRRLVRWMMIVQKMLTWYLCML
jgi:hypothetical protein